MSLVILIEYRWVADSVAAGRHENSLSCPLKYNLVNGYKWISNRARMTSFPFNTFAIVVCLCVLIV